MYSLEERKAQQGTSKDGELPTEAKMLRAKYEENEEMRKKAEQKLNLALNKIRETKQTFEKALEVLCDVEKVVEKELQDQQEYGKVAQLPPGERERQKEEEWQQWMDGRNSKIKFVIFFYFFSLWLKK